MKFSALSPIVLSVVACLVLACVGSTETKEGKGDRSPAGMLADGEGAAARTADPQARLRANAVALLMETPTPEPEDPSNCNHLDDMFPIGVFGVDHSDPYPQNPTFEGRNMRIAAESIGWMDYYIIPFDSSVVAMTAVFSDTPIQDDEGLMRIAVHTSNGFRHVLVDHNNMQPHMNWSFRDPLHVTDAGPINQRVEVRYDMITPFPEDFRIGVILWVAPGLLDFNQPPATPTRRGTATPMPTPTRKPRVTPTPTHEG